MALIKKADNESVGEGVKKREPSPPAPGQSDGAAAPETGWPFSRPLTTERPQASAIPLRDSYQGR